MKMGVKILILLKWGYKNRFGWKRLNQPQKGMKTAEHNGVILTLVNVGTTSPPPPPGDETLGMKGYIRCMYLHDVKYHAIILYLPCWSFLPGDIPPKKGHQVKYMITLVHSNTCVQGTLWWEDILLSGDTFSERFPICPTLRNLWRRVTCQYTYSLRSIPFIRQQTCVPSRQVSLYILIPSLCFLTAMWSHVMMLYKCMFWNTYGMVN